MVLRSAARLLLAAGLMVAGTAHFLRTEEFLAQVPPWIPGPMAVIYISGVIEIALGLALIIVRQRRRQVGWIVAAFFVAIFPGNISQWLTHADAFGLDSDRARLVRLFFQPLLVVWALYSTRSPNERIRRSAN